MNHISLKNRPKCYTKSPTAQDAFQPIPGLISCMHTYGTLTNMKHEVIQLHHFVLVVKFLVEITEEVHLASLSTQSSPRYMEGFRKAAGAKA